MLRHGVTRGERIHGWSRPPCGWGRAPFVVRSQQRRRGMCEGEAQSKEADIIFGAVPPVGG